MSLKNNLILKQIYWQVLFNILLVIAEKSDLQTG